MLTWGLCALRSLVVALFFVSAPAGGSITGMQTPFITYLPTPYTSVLVNSIPTWGPRYWGAAQYGTKVRFRC